MKTILLASAVAALGVAASAVLAEPYVDYTPHKGAWHVMTLKVDPNHIDDYLVGLKKAWIPGEEVAKKHGIIDTYQIMTKMNAEGSDANVLLVEHIPSLDAMEPDQARDQAMEKEVFAIMSRDKIDAQVKDFEKYRSFVTDEYWNELTFTK
jgi:hypothetical protein